MEQIKKEVTAGTAALKKEINQEFASMTLQQIQQLKGNSINLVNPLVLKEIRENVTLVNMTRQ